MVKSPKKIRWNKRATENFESAIGYIRKDSAKNAEKVKQDIILQTKDIAFHPEKYPLDKYKINNDGNFRAFEKHHFRVVYRVFASRNQNYQCAPHENGTIRILMLHTATLNF